MKTLLCATVFALVVSTTARPLLNQAAINGFTWLERICKNALECLPEVRSCGHIQEEDQTKLKAAVNQLAEIDRLSNLVGEIRSNSLKLFPKVTSGGRQGQEEDQTKLKAALNQLSEIERLQELVEEIRTNAFILFPRTSNDGRQGEIEEDNSSAVCKLCSLRCN